MSWFLMQRHHISVGKLYLVIAVQNFRTVFSMKMLKGFSNIANDSRKKYTNTIIEPFIMISTGKKKLHETMRLTGYTKSWRIQRKWYLCWNHLLQKLQNPCSCQSNSQWNPCFHHFWVYHRCSYYLQERLLATWTLGRKLEINHYKETKLKSNSSGRIFCSVLLMCLESTFCFWFE